MKTYWILSYTVINPEAYQFYVKGASEIFDPLVNAGKAKMLINTHNLADTKLEGEPGNDLVVVEFVNREIAENFYYSKGYQSWIKARQEATENGWVVLIDEYQSDSI